MRVTPHQQTLILAGEVLPRRSVGSSNGQSGGQRVTYISARVDAVVQSSYSASTDAAAFDSIEDADFKDVSPSGTPAVSGKPSTAVATRAYSSYAAASRGTPFNGASAYAQTQDQSERHPIIDTYA